MSACIVCGGSLEAFTDRVRDWEYGVDWSSSLVRCVSCALVTHSPPVKASDIAGLYPDNYLAHSAASGGGGVYGWLKQRLADRSTKAIDRYLPGGATMLEVGSGNGHFLAQVARQRPDVQLIGVDISDPGHLDIPNYRFLHGQLHEVELEPGSIDLIYCSNLIEHVADPIEFVDICVSLL